MKSIPEILAEELGQKLEYVQNVVNLMDEGNTIPFIARYRKEMHGAMDDTTLRNLETRLTYLRNLQERRDEVKKSIENQGKLTQELSDAIDGAATMAEVEDLYRPYKQKRRTRGSIAREKGLAPLAEAIFAQDGQDPAGLAAGFIDPEKGVNSVEEALQGANDIIAEDLSDDADIRKSLRELVMRRGTLICTAAEDAEADGVYKLYYDFSQPISRVLDHQILAMNRGEKEGFLSVTVLLDRDTVLPVLRRAAAAAPAPAASTLRFGDIVLDDVSRTVRVGGVPVELTFKEYALLHLFLEHPEEVLARERIMKDVWDTDDLLESRTIDMHVRTLRQKLGAAGEAIRTVRKVGYKLSTEGSDD